MYIHKMMTGLFPGVRSFPISTVKHLHFSAVFVYLSQGKYEVNARYGQWGSVM